MKVYAAAAWWRDCDPFASVIALDQQKCETLIKQAIEEEAGTAYNDSEPEDERDEDDFLSDIAWSGVHEDELENCKLSDEQEYELITDGYVFLDAS